MGSKSILSSCGRRIWALRRERGWTQEELAHQCGLDRSYIGGVERGERNVSLVNIEKLARALGVTVSEMLDGL